MEEVAVSCQNQRLWTFNEEPNLTIESWKEATSESKSVHIDQDNEPNDEPANATDAKHATDAEHGGRRREGPPARRAGLGVWVGGSLCGWGDCNRGRIKLVEIDEGYESGEHLYMFDRAGCSVV